MSDPRGHFPLIGRLRQDGGVHSALKKPPVGNWPERLGLLNDFLGKERRHFGFSHNGGLPYLPYLLSNFELVGIQLVLIMSATSFNMACRDTETIFNFSLSYKQSKQCLRSIIDITLSDFSVQDPPSPPPYPPNPPPSPA
ncbi:hypothetical protein AFLA_010053 [Aspergillus flavus NRRL3357]|uniref:Uncharacterized protein n=1 Tax=Aspergillus flavus TaxID=5059 RepID=A0AB74C6W3_ASPFL|nr:hypothetical protein AFLA_010053 [Aspergillus flavus NRRL3357]RMZ42336.1 hypothetical protein CA14_002988 [Aspergillus flavus]